MAKFKKEILGKVSGTLGDITFRQRNGKSYVSVRPGSFIPGKDPASIARREKFALTIKLSQMINNIQYLKILWESEAPSGSSAFNLITKTNYKYVNTVQPSDLVLLAPKPMFNISNPVVNLSSSLIQVDADAIGTTQNIDLSVETSIKLIAVVHLNNPADNLSEKNKFISFVSDSQTLTLDSPLSFSVNINGMESQLYTKYQNQKGYFIFITLDSQNNVVRCSNSFAS